MTDREREALLAAKVDDILHLPFHTGGEYGVEDYDYEVESVMVDTDGGVNVRLIRLDAYCRRQRNRRGHFVRNWRRAVP